MAVRILNLVTPLPHEGTAMHTTDTARVLPVCAVHGQRLSSSSNRFQRGITMCYGTQTQDACAANEDSQGRTAEAVDEMTGYYLTEDKREPMEVVFEVLEDVGAGSKAEKLCAELNALLTPLVENAESFNAKAVSDSELSAIGKKLLELITDDREEAAKDAAEKYVDYFGEAA